MKQFNRVEALIGKENLEKITSKKVLVIGLGGVGGTAVESLVRSGISDIVIVDNDIIDITNLNRQIISLYDTIGKQKVEVMKERILRISKLCKVKTIQEFINSENINILFEEKIDYVIDACDTIDTKKEIIFECVKRNIPFISCMGTAKKTDPTQLSITELTKTSYDPIAKILRRWAKDNRIRNKIPVVSTTEKISDDIDKKTLASMCFVPNTAGMLCAKYVIDDILKK